MKFDSPPLYQGKRINPSHSHTAFFKMHCSEAAGTPANEGSQCEKQWSKKEATRTPAFRLG